MAELPIEQIRNDLNMDDLQYEVESLRAERDALREALAPLWRVHQREMPAHICERPDDWWTGAVMAYEACRAARLLGQPCERKETGR